MNISLRYLLTPGNQNWRQANTIAQLFYSRDFVKSVVEQCIKQPQGGRLTTYDPPSLKIDKFW